MLITHKTRKAFAFLVAVIMIIGLLPIHVFAVDGEPTADALAAWQVINENPTKELDWEDRDTRTNPVVTVSKTAAPVKGEDGKWVEGKAEITLTVETRDKVEVSEEEINADPSVDVVLLIDNSASMSNNDSPRLNNAKTAANAFVDKFMAGNNGKRKVAVVTYFGDDKDISVKTNSALTASTSALTTAINGISAKVNSGTDIQAGLRRAGELLADSAADYRFIVLLTDGEPTYYYEGTGDAITMDASNFIRVDSYQQTTRHDAFSSARSGDGGSSGESQIYNTASQAWLLKNSGIEIFGIGMDLINSNAARYTMYNVVTHTVSEAGVRSCDDHYFAYDGTNGDTLGVRLSSYFERIVHEIFIKTQAWRVSDEMGDMVTFAGIAEDYDFGPSASFNPVDNTLRWDLTSPMTQVEEIGTGADKLYRYTFQYYVTLNSLADGYTADTPYVTNKEATLTWYFEGDCYEEDGDGHQAGETILHSGTFPQPQIRGYDGDFILQKRSAVAPYYVLSAAKFELIAKGGGSFRREAGILAPKLGTVSFLGIPSGHTYTLNEIMVQEPYDMRGGVGFTVQVNWGKVTLLDRDGQEVLPDENNLYPIYNPVLPGSREIPVTKIWMDGDDVIHPNATVTLYQNNGPLETWEIGGTEVDLETHIFTDLPLRSTLTGELYEYTIGESEVSGYTTVIDQDGYSIVNTRSGVRDITVYKKWVHLADTVPVEIVITITGISKGGDPVTFEETLAAGATSVTFRDLPRYDEDGNPYTYTATDSVGGYSAIAVTAGEDELEITLINIMNHAEETSVAGEKLWRDDNDASGDRPASIYVQLFADGVAVGAPTPVSDSGDWRFSFTGLPMYAVEREGDTASAIRYIAYTVLETDASGNPVPGIVTYGDTDYRVHYENGNIINTRTGLRDIPVSKDWPANADDDTLYAVVELDDGSGRRLTLNSANEWSDDFTDLPRYNDMGEEIEYGVNEIECSPGYYRVETAGDMESGFVLKNDYTSAMVVEVTKVWKDGGDTSARAPLTFTLYADGAEKESKVMESGETQLFFDNLSTHKYDAEGNPFPIEYTVVEETSLGGYSASWVRTPATGTGDDGKVSYTFTNLRVGTAVIQVDKMWIKPDGIAAPDISFTLRGNGTDVETKGWEGVLLTFTADKYDDSGAVILYTVVENYTGSDYEMDVKESVGGDGALIFFFVNTMRQTYRTLSGTKTWFSDAAVPETIHVAVFADDVLQDVFAVTPASGSFILPGQWPVYTIDGGSYTPIEYTLRECNADGTVIYEAGAVFTAANGEKYTVRYGSESGSAISNTQVQAFTDVAVTKNWLAPGGDAHPAATFTLYQWLGGEAVVHDTWTTTAGSTDPGESHTFANLPIFTGDRTGTYTYTVEETGVPDGYHLKSFEGGVFLNEIDQADVTIRGTKTWSVTDPSKIPEEIGIEIYRGAETTPIATLTVVPVDGVWRFSHTIPNGKYDANGQPVQYYVREAGVNGVEQALYGEALFDVTYDAVISDENGDLIANLTNRYADEFFYQYEVRTYYRTIVRNITILDGIAQPPVIAEPNPPFLCADEQWYYGHGVQGDAVTLDSILAGDQTAIDAQMEEFAGYTGFDTAALTGRYDYVTTSGVPSVTLLDPSPVLYEISHYYERVINLYRSESTDDDDETGGGDGPGGNQPGGGDQPGGNEQQDIIDERVPMVNPPSEQQDIIDEQIPLSELPILEKADEDLPAQQFEIVDETMPLGDLPQTGTAGMPAGGEMGLLAAVSMIAIGWTLFGRRKEEEA